MMAAPATLWSHGAANGLVWQEVTSGIEYTEAGKVREPDEHPIVRSGSAMDAG